MSDSFLLVSKEKLLRLADALGMASELLRSLLDAEGAVPEVRQEFAVDRADFVPSEDELARQLHVHRGNVAAVARHFDRAPMQVRRWIRRHRLELDSFRG